MKKKNLVSLVTEDRNLEAVMLQDYPGFIKKYQHPPYEDKEHPMYIFTELEKEVLSKFLKQYDFSYVIINEPTINPLDIYIPLKFKINKIKKQRINSSL